MQPRGIREEISRGRDAKERGRRRVAAVVRALASMELAWVDPETGWEFALDSAPRAIASKRDGNRHGTAQELTVRKDGAVIFQDRVQCWDGSPVLVPTGTFDVQGNPNYREDPAEALRLDLAHTVKVVTKGGEQPWVKAKPGTVSTFFSTTDDAYVQSQSTSYASARGGTGATAITGAAIWVGQVFVSPNYFVAQTFVGFDTSAIGTDDISAAVFSLDGRSDASTTDFVAEVSVKDWSPSVAAGDFVAGASLPAAIATFNSSGYSAGYNDFTEVGTGLQDAINKTGVTYLMVASDRQRTNNAPTGGERIEFSSADNAGTTSDPKLVVTHEPALTLVDVAGAQPAAIGEIAALSYKSLSGSLPSMSGSISAKTTNKFLQGNLPAMAGALSFTRPLTHISLVGSLPSMSGSIEHLFLQSLEGILPAQSGVVTVQSFASVDGNLPSMSGDLTIEWVNKLITGNLPSMIGDLTILQYIDLSGSLPAMSGDLTIDHILQHVSLAGVLPAMSGDLTILLIISPRLILFAILELPRYEGLLEVPNFFEIINLPRNAKVVRLDIPEEIIGLRLSDQVREI